MLNVERGLVRRDLTDMHSSQDLRIRSLGPLTFVFYDVDEEGFEGIVAAHCLELDIGGQGATRDEARKNLQAAVEAFVVFHLEESLPFGESRAPEELEGKEDREVHHLVLVQQPETSQVHRVVFSEPPSSFGAGFSLAN